MISLAAVYQAFERRCQHFIHMTTRALSGTRKARDHEVSHVVIELQSALSYVARSAYLAGTIGGWRANGTKMARSFGSATESLLAAARVVKKKPVDVPGRDEPSWQSSDHMARIATTINPANVSAFMTATSAYPDVLAAMTAARNFYAHRGQHTHASAARTLSDRLSIPTKGHLTDVLLSFHGAGAPLLEVWCWNYLDVVALICDR